MKGKTNRIARRYAKALVQTLGDEKEYNTIKAELELYLELFEQIKELRAGMETLLFSKPQKKEMIKSINTKISFSRKTHNFLNSLIDQNRLSFLKIILEFMEDLWMEHKGVEKLKVFSVIKLNKELEKKLKHCLKKCFKRDIILQKEIDRSLIGGIKIQRGYIYYDFSIQGNLKRLKEKLAEEY